MCTAAVRVTERAVRDGFRVALLHAHVGSGPQQEEFDANVGRLAELFGRPSHAHRHA